MRKFIASSSVFALLIAASSACASPLVFNLDTEFSSAQNPAGTPPWLRATFSDAGANTVQLHLQAVGLAGAEFVSIWMFNAHVSNPISDLSIAHSSGVNAAVAIRDYNGNNAHKMGFKADGDGFFDFKFEWNQGVFAASDQAVFILTGTGITASTFEKLSEGAGNSPDGLYTAAHVQGILGGGSGWITTHVIPLPAAGGLALAGLALLGGVRRRRN
jgi:hypothetical protein